MAIVNSSFFVEKKVGGGNGVKPSYRRVWIIKKQSGNSISIGTINFPKRFLGKKVRLKVVFDEDVISEDDRIKKLEDEIKDLKYENYKLRNKII